MAANLIDPPLRGAQARFASHFGQRALLTVDTEEEFDWSAPFKPAGHSLDHVPRLRKFQQFCEGIGVSPVYLIDWPVATSELAVQILGNAISGGKAEIGIQLHPWVNPPHEEEVNTLNSFAGNLPPELEHAKFTKLHAVIAKNFKTEPLIYRAGRYGLGPNSAAMLRQAGIPIDSSVRANFDYSENGGPDYSAHPLTPYWAGDDGALLELPLTTVYWGMLRKQGHTLFPKLQNMGRLRGIMARAGMLERIPLTPEGVSVDEAIRGIDMALDDGLPLLVLSFHSPSLSPGNTPYVRTEDDLDSLYDWWRRVYTYLDMRGVKPVTVKQVMAAVETTPKQ
ncbi:polysaccharide deacetylase family protein [Altererythrobacter aquiaggeris]|uniref:polysaccharide deacetylase family protein n=1 Tax=Aestuarierythrobacter aquiaggeris TaxID=1898396 RepID=UPI00301A5BFC